jgi:hypothetical protein
MIIQRLFSEKKEKIHKKSNAVYATGAGLSIAGGGILGNTIGRAKGRKLAAEEYLREATADKEGEIKKIGNVVAKKYLKSKKGTLALGAGTTALGVGLVGKSIKMREEEDSKAKKNDNSKK